MCSGEHYTCLHGGQQNGGLCVHMHCHPLMCVCVLSNQHSSNNTAIIITLLVGKYYTTGREIIAKKILKTHRLSGKACEDLDSTIVIVIFY